MNERLQSSRKTLCTKSLHLDLKFDILGTDSLHMFHAQITKVNFEFAH